MLAAALTLGPTGRAEPGTMTAEVVAVTEETVLVDVHAQTGAGAYRGWLVLGRDGAKPRKLWRERPKAAGPADCDEATQKFAAVLAELHLDGVRLDARQCGRHDGPWWAASQPLADEPAAARPNDRLPLNVTVVSVDRLRRTRETMAFGTFTSKLWSARFTGKSLEVLRNRQPWASFQSAMTAAPGAWVVVAPGGAFVVAFDPQLGHLQAWARQRGAWRTLALVDPVEPG